MHAKSAPCPTTPCYLVFLPRPVEGGGEGAGRCFKSFRKQGEGNGAGLGTALLFGFWFLGSRVSSPSGAEGEGEDRLLVCRHLGRLQHDSEPARPLGHSPSPVGDVDKVQVLLGGGASPNLRGKASLHRHAAVDLGFGI
jgi:hypothetical protein